MTNMTRRRCSTVMMAALLLCWLVAFDRRVHGQVTTAAFPSPPPSPTCKDGASPGVIQLTPDPSNANKLALARKWITNYEPLSSPSLRVGFYEARTTWLNVALAVLEKKLDNGSRIQTTISDKDGVAFFYNLCPGTYYVSTVAPIDNAGVDV